jgi:hypothetical protein
MTLSKHLREVESIFENPDFSGVSNYWFSYINCNEIYFDAYRDKICLGEKFHCVCVELRQINRIELVYGNNKASANDCGIFISGTFGQITVPITTMSKNKYLDVFPIFQELSRQVKIVKAEEPRVPGTLRN